MAHSSKRLIAQCSLVLGLAGATLAGLAFLLDGELRGRSLDSARRKPVAKLGYALRTIERKLDKEVIWEGVSKDEVLFNRDAVRTASGAEARIRFDDGTVLEMSENSLVILDRSDDRIGIEFLRGNVFARGGGSGARAVEFTTSSGKVRVGGAGSRGALALSAGKSGLEVTVSEGTAQVQTSQGSTSIGANERGKVGELGVTKQKINLIQKSPAAGARFIQRQNQSGKVPIDFAWSAADGKPVKARVQIASDPDFEKLVASSSAAGQARLELAEGGYFWRVVTFENGRTRDASQTRALRVLKYVPPRLESPAPRAVQAYFREKPTPRFAWQAGSAFGSGSERIELSSDPSFRKAVSPARIARGPTSEAVFDGLDPGNYYWRVVSRYEGVGADGQGVVEIPTETRVFGLAQLERLPAPQLVEPAPGAFIGLPSGSSRVRFQWQPSPEAGGYRLRIASDVKLSATLADIWSAAPEWEGEIPVLGSLYWTVQAVTRESLAAKAARDENSLPAQARLFQASRVGGFRLIAPADGQKIEFLGDKPQVRFAWEKHTGARSYELQIAADPSFSSILASDRVKADIDEAPELKTDEVPVGDRYWRVRALDDNDRVLALSAVGRYGLNPKPLLAAPEKLAPAPELELKAEPPPRARFAWKPVEGAIAYRVTAWKQAAGGKLEPAWSEDTEALELERKLDEGVYEWDVRAIDAIKRPGAAGASRLLAVRQPDRLAAPQLTSPAFGTRIEDDAPKSVLLKWESVDGAEAYQVNVYRSAPDGSKQLVKSARTTDTRLELPDTVATGAYVWQVAAIGVAPHAQSRVARPGEAATSQFAIRWVGILRAPAKVQVSVEADGESPK